MPQLSHTSEKVRLTTLWTGNVFGGSVRRISVIGALAVSMLGQSVGQSADPPKAAQEIRIIPKRRTVPPPAPMIDDMRPAAPTAKPPAQPYEPTVKPGIAPPTPSATLYADVIRSIPFSRAEYEQNPSYRQETAMAIVFGQMPQVSIIKNMGPPNVKEYGYITPYRYQHQDGNSMNYNFFYPKPSVYRNY